jgi:hypothetical protein
VSPELICEIPNFPGATTADGWTQGDYYYVAWGAPLARALPQIYRTDAHNAWQWQKVSLYGAQQEPAGKILFSGTMTQYTDCSDGEGPVCQRTANLPHTAWSQLWNSLNSNSQTSVLGLSSSTDIGYED